MCCRIHGRSRNFRPQRLSRDPLTMPGARRCSRSDIPIELSAIPSCFRLIIVRSLFHQMGCVFSGIHQRQAIWKRTFADGDEAMKVSGMQLRDLSRRRTLAITCDAILAFDVWIRNPQPSVAHSLAHRSRIFTTPALLTWNLRLILFNLCTNTSKTKISVQ